MRSTTRVAQEMGDRRLTRFRTKRLALVRDAVAPDGSDVRVLLGFFVSGRGDMWRKREGQEEIVSVEAGVCLAVVVTMPPWPGEAESIVLRGKWEATVP
jgi:mannose-6-phosphate isomerase-like protein (cupin superfamily)